jgi:hypothetical protein
MGLARYDESGVRASGGNVDLGSVVDGCGSMGGGMGMNVLVKRMYFDDDDVPLVQSRKTP